MRPIGVIRKEGGRRVVEWHAPPIPGPDYHTLCCVDADDPATGTFGTVEAPVGRRINCQHCHRIWAGVLALNLRANHFTPKARNA